MEALACALTLIISWGVNFCNAESGFLSLDCGGTENRTDSKTGITWTTDEEYIQAGYRRGHNDPNLEFYQQSLRVFPNPVNKSCYNLPISPNVPFLLRLYFVGVNYTIGIPQFYYSIETKDMLSLRIPTAQSKPPEASEKILVSGGETLYICLIRSSEDVDPFISSIELRPLRQGMYAQVSPGLMLHSLMRVNLGAYQPMRYPQDQFDRTWDPGYPVDGVRNISSLDPISTNYTQDLPPPLVMQTAFSTVDNKIDFLILPQPPYNLLFLNFAEIQNISGSRILDIFINGKTMLTDLHHFRNNCVIEVSFLVTEIDLFTLSKASNSTMGPMLNAFELYQGVNSLRLTSSGDGYYITPRCS